MRETKNVIERELNVPALAEHMTAIMVATRTNVNSG